MQTNSLNFTLFFSLARLTYMGSLQPPKGLNTGGDYYTTWPVFLSFAFNSACFCIAVCGTILCFEISLIVDAPHVDVAAHEGQLRNILALLPRLALPSLLLAFTFASIAVCPPSALPFFCVLLGVGAFAYSIAQLVVCFLLAGRSPWMQIHALIQPYCRGRLVDSQRPAPLLKAAEVTMSAEAVLEVAIYIHRFHNLDLFQQGWYQIKVTSSWEGSDDVPGVPSRVVQYEAPDATDDSTAIWQIDDVDHSFCTRPFRIKYARQDIHLAVMISFNLSLRVVERLLLNAVIVSFELLHAPIDLIASSSNGSLEYTSCASHDFRIPPKALLGLHAYCPIHFDTWHMVLIDVTVHSVLLKVNSSSFSNEGSKEDHTNGNLLREDKFVKAASRLELDARDIALLKALNASSQILRHELKSLGLAINQHVPLEAKECASVALVLKKLNPDLVENGATMDGEKRRNANDQNWSQLVADSLKLNEHLESMEGAEAHPGFHSVSRSELLEAFHELGGDLSILWNVFLKFHRSHRSLLWEHLKRVWAEERTTEWSMWLIHVHMDILSNGSRKDLDSLSHNMQLLSKPVVKKPIEEASVVSASRADLHRKTLEQLKMNSRALQDMQIFGMPSLLPILVVESHTVPIETIASNTTLPSKHIGSGTSFLLEKPGNLLQLSSKSPGKILRVVVFVHGFQGHHLDLRLVRNQWLLIDPNAECLMSEINEDRTTSDFRELGHNLAEEVAAFMKTKFGSFLKKATYSNCRLSFVGHSIGNIIIRAALNDPLMKPFLEYLHTYLSISGPHLGYLYSSNTLFNSGLWLLKKLKASPCMHQLTFTDEANIQDCFLFKLSEEKTFEYFQNVLLLSSPQDRYVPYHSARVEMCQAAARDSRRGAVYMSMHRNCMDQILKPTIVERNFLRCDVNFNTSSQARSLNNLIGRTAHIEFLETDTFLRFLMWTFPKYFF
ncbi:hypothetical protein GOP47_0007556 [Adiantum capillus-veneris]|uniref:DUF676 domain-containing protein n=1 Tax=Adiantum capillus-veneris TaxID=13818 RepID=A0A9D4V1S3_ADICA|nr:hypothetical protein GOP47_0007556 [Adiantum capillus-veneris]